MSPVGYVNVSFELWGSILCFIILLCLLIGKNGREKINRVFVCVLACNIIVLVSDAAAWLFKGHATPVSYWGVRVSNFLVFTVGYLLLTFFMYYMTAYIGRRTKVSRLPLRVIQGLCAAAVLFVVISQFSNLLYSFDGNNVYHRGSWFWLSQIWGIVGMCVIGGMLIRYRRSLTRTELIALSSYIVLPAVAMCVQIFIYGIALLNLMTTAAILIVFLFIETEQARRLQEKEQELAESRIAGMISQIQPHFLFNSLTAIRQLCDSDPEQAKEAIVEFSNYLRGNLDALTMAGCIPFERELEQVRNYLSLEEKRFGSTLRVEYDLQAGGFSLPPLTVQPIVENAVRHGITKKKGGGTIRIGAYETERDYRVTVSDDGVGIRTLPDTGKNHVGIENVKKRLEAICNGKLLLESEIDCGTRATIMIPKGGAANAHDCSGR